MTPLYKLAAQFLVPILMLSSAYPASREELGIGMPDRARLDTKECQDEPCALIMYDIGEEPDGIFDMIEYYAVLGYDDSDLPVLGMDPYAIWKDSNGDGRDFNPDGSPQLDELFLKVNDQWYSLGTIWKEFRDYYRTKHGI